MVFRINSLYFSSNSRLRTGEGGPTDGLSKQGNLERVKDRKIKNYIWYRSVRFNLTILLVQNSIFETQALHKDFRIWRGHPPHLSWVVIEGLDGFPRLKPHIMGDSRLTLPDFLLFLSSHLAEHSLTIESPSWAPWTYDDYRVDAWLWMAVPSMVRCIPHRARLLYAWKSPKGSPRGPKNTRNKRDNVSWSKGHPFKHTEPEEDDWVESEINMKWTLWEISTQDRWGGSYRLYLDLTNPWNP
jgi:hypothetical protein